MASYKAVIFDMGDVLFTWNPQADTQVTHETLAHIVQSTTWNRYERGLLSAEQCYGQFSSDFAIPPSDLAETFKQTTGSLKPDSTMTMLLHRLKAQGYRLYMMTNIPQLDFDLLRNTEYVWHLFDRIFASGYVGMRKPDLEFYQWVLNVTGLTAAEGIFVDDKEENVAAAERVGMLAIHFRNAAATSKELQALLNLA
ncbi:hypothetical protein CBS147343_9864 [Aspergillus niger]|uniref:Haloacid dehalogenase-like hydrolase family protein n=2 Tax=Aspergillus niger TaxID=5061 RepID=A0A254TQ24_ASPNG|nr:hypothetical protein CBS147371_8657 [Aspergillus niger]KAI2928780.1 hypothetical protein CBS147321_10982 [Aspergillus niger]KAI2975683.1 hypothetical protein CBS147324_3018 [Aspergillus niger]KAI3016063.1 hypothetical protein CBS147482_3102 [Aspergillus niger]KAI3024571.1 hypothetical protein CBS147345_2950 [Aspergillus niger]